MNKPKMKFAIVGYGRIGKRHAEMIQQNPDSELVAVCDILPVNIENIPVFNTLEEMLTANIAMDVVNICTPNGLHAQQAIQVLDAKKHVVIEKPMALTRAACEEIIFKALNVSRQVFCVMQNRYSPPSIWLKSLLTNGQLGDIYLVEINCYWNRDERYYKVPADGFLWKGTKALDGGVLFTQFAHFLDIMYWIFGDITNIQTRTKNFNHTTVTEFEDTGVVQFELVNGGLGVLTFTTACWDTNFESSITVIGSKGSVKIGGQYMDKVEYCHVQNYAMPVLDSTNPANQYGTYQGSAANHHMVIQNVIEVIKGHKAPTTNALEGMKVVDIIERIYKKFEVENFNLL
ncbi:MAG: Gfo/Idh/MocA family oxidoreductase [Saprospiraceae bacterium]|nr:Gfo/Idh/MocA family oxidoreductase [Saprospiraceae bacterium]